MVKPSKVQQYASVVKALSLPQYSLINKPPQVIVTSATPTRPDIEQVRFKVEYKCPPGWTPH